MKKILLLLLLVLSSLFVLAQEPIKLKTYKNCVGYYNERTREYDFEDYFYAGITFSIYDNYISVDDKNHSLYRIIENLPKVEDGVRETTKARCLDEQNRECIVGVITYSDNSVKPSIGIMYNNKLFLYIIEK